jgi:hypothetical protein
VAGACNTRVKMSYRPICVIIFGKSDEMMPHYGHMSTRDDQIENVLWISSV